MNGYFDYLFCIASVFPISMLFLLYANHVTFYEFYGLICTVVKCI
jgi:hypothetical protein